MAKAERFQDKIVVVLSEEEASDIFHLAHAHIGGNCLPFIYNDVVFQDCGNHHKDPFNDSGMGTYRRVDL